MKKVNVKSKLSLNKETIAKLNHNQMNTVRGGGAEGAPPPTKFCAPTGSAVKCCIPPTNQTFADSCMC